MKKHLLVMAAVAVSGMLLSCTASDEPELGEAKRVVNMLSGAKPVELTEPQKVFASDNNGFTLQFLKQVGQTDCSGKSFVYSPLSITYVLGMVNDAAEGATRQELEQTLGFHEGGIQAVNDYCRNLIENLPKVDEKVQLNIANAIFVNNKCTLKDQFQKDMQTYYSATAEALDFTAPATLNHINDWAKEQTNGMIPTILDKVDPKMVSYLLNAIYFKADWASKFDEKNTRTETFATENGSTRLPMMHQNVLIAYTENDTYAAVSIPYGNGMWNMTVFLPAEGKTTDDVVTRLSDIGWPLDNPQQNPFSEAAPYEVDLKLPRYETNSDTDKLSDGLIGLLRQMGIRLAFDAFQAEIPNMCEGRDLYIEMMRQKAAVKVNEEGSEAAAVTVAGVTNLASVYPGEVEYPKATFHANRPFVYLIREASSGVILFVGKFTGE